jgi:hypothetical protein
MKTVITFSKEEIEQILKEKIPANGCTKIEPVIEEVCKGIGMNERYEMEFVGYRVEL